MKVKDKLADAVSKMKQIREEAKRIADQERERQEKQRKEQEQ